MAAFSPMKRLRVISYEQPNRSPWYWVLRLQASHWNVQICVQVKDQIVHLFLSIMVDKGVSRWIETLKDEETHWLPETGPIILKKSVSEGTSRAVETKLGPLRGCPATNWSDMTTKNWEMYQVGVIVKSIVSVRDHLLVGQLSTTWLLWIVFSAVKVEERGLKAFKRHATLTILKMDVYLQVRNFPYT